MTRLTGKDESPCTWCDGIGYCRTDCSYMQIYDRLAEYEDAEEQGRLIVLPCKVGDTVYVINGPWVREYSVASVYWDGIFFQFQSENESYVEDCRRFSFFDERIGETVFLTEEEAKKALKGENDGC